MTTEVIIPFHGRADLMSRCLAAFEPRSVFSRRIVVVDDGSTAADARAVRAAVARLPERVEWIEFRSRVGFVRAVNAAWSRCTEPIVFVLNSDTIPTQAALQQMEAAIAGDPRLAAAAPATDNPCDLYQFRGAARETGLVRPLLTRVPCLTAACIAVRRHAVAGPLFDTVFSPGYFEDFDLSCRLRARGWHLAVVEDCRIHHTGRATFGRVPDIDALLTRNYAVFASRWSHTAEYADLQARLTGHTGAVGERP